MPKAKPDEVIVHRIELQQTEREILEMAGAAYSFDRVTRPIVALINDNTTMLLILTTVAGWLGIKYIPPALSELEGDLRGAFVLLRSFQEQYESAVEQGLVDRKSLTDLLLQTVDPANLRSGPLVGLVNLINPEGRQDVAQGYSYARPEGWAEAIFGGGQQPILNPDGSEWQPGDPRPY